jgi:Ca2+-transporting ATPase
MDEVSGEGFEPAGTISSHGIPADLRKNQTLRRLMQIAVLCSNAQLVEEKSQARKWRGNGQAKSAWNVKGDPTEGALLVLAAKCGVSESSLKDTYKRVGEIPFDSERKRMSVVVEHQAGRLVYTKGAPDVLLQLCSYILWENKVVPLTPSLRQQVLQMNEELAGMALRVLGAAYRECPPGEADADSKLEQNLIFVGLMGMIDPPRKEVPQAIRTCRSAGIKTVMITGDHRATAEAIARRLGMVPEGGLIVDGAELSRMNDDELDSKVENIYVYARVSPEHKLRIVKALQRKGHVVAMTGDGVNDAPAIKSADIGIAMGQSGTDVAKEASALILSDDNFASIVAAIEEGRGIYENIRKFIRYILASNVGEIMTMFIAMMAGMPLPLVPIQILWVNLVTDGLPAMALGVDQPEEDLMRQKPRSATESIFARGIGWKVISRGILIGLCTLAAFWLILKKGPGDAETLTKAQTVAFATLVLAQLIHVFDCRSSRSIFHRNILENKYLLLAVLSSLALLLAVIYIEMLQPIFKTTGLDHRDWIVVFIFAGIPTFVAGIEGFFPKNKRNKRQFRYGSKPMMR